ncbi:DUF6531 domain-containing protein [Paracidovorax cattleyae]|uniref:DUF6531 domain-containing protein n=1 Tax=Paracidovorax cattleyae TaxID=80868 RepID=UPI0022A92CB7|nr:DUF6531 domain-containing protein [Paracidovorax cattleyae]
MGGMAAARQADEIGHVSVWARLARVGLRLASGRAAMRAVADAAVCRDHGQPNANFIAEGSDSVFIETYPAARKGDKMMCAAQIASGSDDVLVGGNKTAYLEIADDRAWWETALEIGVGLAMGRGSFLGKVGCLALGAVVGYALGRGFRALIGYPVHPATGGKVLDGSRDTDFVLPGPLAIAWRRFYSSHDHREGTLHGAGWSVPYEIELHVERCWAASWPSMHRMRRAGRCTRCGTSTTRWATARARNCRPWAAADRDRWAGPCCGAA